MKRRFPYANLKYHYKAPLWVINLLIRKYQVSNVAKCIESFNEHKRFQSPFDRDLEPYIDLEMFTTYERKQLEKSWKNKDEVKSYKVVHDMPTGQFTIKADQNLTIHTFKRLILT